MKRKDRSAVRVMILLALLTLILYRNVVFRPGVIYGKDTIAQGYPLNYYMSKAGDDTLAPTWMPYMMSGFPTTPSIYPGEDGKSVPSVYF